MTTFYLIRHGHNDFIGKSIVGWTPGVNLSGEGRQQAERLARKLVARGITRLVSSPLERARQTAEPLATALDLPVEIREALGEVKFGEWEGKSFDELDRDPRWKLFNSYRSGTRAPGGELALESQGRVVRELECLAAQYPGETIAVFSHSDIIRSALVYYLGVPIDLYQRITCRPASYSVLKLSEWGPVVDSVNESAD